MESLPCITEKALDSLRKTLSGRIKEHRFLHTLGVEKEIVKLGKIYLPQDILRLRAAALLHDVTKEYTTQEQLELCRRYHLPVTEVDRLSPKIFHARTAVGVIQDEFSAFADPVILDAIAKHTTGAREMSLFAKLLYLADYIEETRTFDDCVMLRQAFWEPIFALSQEERLAHLNRVLLRSFDMTIVSLLKEGCVIAPATIDSRNALIEEINKHNP
ncbi:MAG: bis(5'-nucleosyl)-tetraphosphatase (symmetrical) YqeK [Clostridia bacterium]|nr:bis(5'-nucleosyl)-tetraphosphatase (symmetrical) YqeK [Clostridia bacterium]